MSALLEPFTGYVPASEYAPRIVGPPVSTLSPDQRQAARSDPLSFRHVVGKGAGAPKKEARQWLHTCQDEGVLTAVGPAVFIYRLAKGDLVTTGIVADVSIAAYDSGLVKRHETTISKTERKMAKYMRSTRIYGNPVALAYREHVGLNTMIAAHSVREADFSFTAADGYAHSLWVVEGAEADELCRNFHETLYITDGHHRLAAASVVAGEEGRMNHHIPAGLFSADELRLRSFARCVIDPDLDAMVVIDRLGSDHHLEEVDEGEARPRGRYEYGVKIGGASYRLRVDDANVPDDLYRSLDVNLLQDLILEPVFGIQNPRQDGRLHFIPDLPEGRDDEEIECGAWFLPYPASVGDVMAVADSGRAMPPKSTWFAPKLPSGLVIRLLDKH
jgi:uncharacterized protein (DUF1015 family)